MVADGTGFSLGQWFADTATTGPLLLALLVAAIAGLVSFASPCVIPLVPGYLSYLAGLVGESVAPMRVPAATGAAGSTDSAGAPPPISRAARRRVAGATALFVLGFTVVFVAGTATIFGLMSTIALNRDLLQRLGGVVMILMGLTFMGLVPWLQRDVRFAPRRVGSLLGAPLLGATFALGWTPCLGPTLAAVISLTAGTEGATAARGVSLIVAYCLGLGLPFVLLAIGSTFAVRAASILRRHSRTIQLIGGVVMILVGAALLAGWWDLFVVWIRDAFVTDVVLPV